MMLWVALWFLGLPRQEQLEFIKAGKEVAELWAEGELPGA
jgi:hypothetical protein